MLKCTEISNSRGLGRVWNENMFPQKILEKDWKNREIIKMCFSMECLMADFWWFFSRNFKICRNVKSVCILISSLLLKPFFLSFTVDKSYPSLLNLSCNFCSISSLFKVLLYCSSILLSRCLLSLMVLIYFSILLTFKQF